MNYQFSTSQINKIIDQSLTYQCACPAQVCRAIMDMRKLHDYQMNCINDSENDKLVHSAIAQATEKSLLLMEDCLKQVLNIEGWDMETLAMPELLKQKIMKSF